ncbi:PIN domain-containing protein [Actinosynnema sp. NPDC050801]|uniref:type II toxin-antitoxin system VapC family toxin n=1 Tax=unclassified Actinosynnema TaxID=2637065 RepID=UPI00340911A8
MARLILDTGVLVAGVRGVLDPTAISDEDDVALAAVAMAEYLAGLLLDGDQGRVAVQRAFLDDLLTTIPVEDYTPAVAEHHAALMAHIRRSGSPRGAHAVIIAATARATNRTLVTTDGRARFGDLPGVDVRLVPVKKR